VACLLLSEAVMERKLERLALALAFVNLLFIIMLASVRYADTNQRGTERWAPETTQELRLAQLEVPQTRDLRYLIPLTPVL
jgi:hypothetical protein